MKKFVSLGSALMMGTVIAKDHAKEKSLGKDQIQNQIFPQRKTQEAAPREVHPMVKQVICPNKVCSKTRTVPYTNPLTGATYDVFQCYNCETDCTCEWEFANNHEIDGTEDGSYWTSIITDNILETSPSLEPAVLQQEEIVSVNTSVATSKTSEERDQVFDLFHRAPQAKQA